MSLKVFVSYSSKDLAWVANLREWLDSIKDLEVDLFVSEYDTPSGASLIDTVKSHIDQADVVLVVLSSNSAQSIWVQQEIGYANGVYRTRGKPVTIPIVIEGGVLPDGMIQGVRAVDVSRDTEVASRQLYEALERLKVEAANRRGLLVLGGIILGLAIVNRQKQQDL